MNLTVIVVGLLLTLSVTLHGKSITLNDAEIQMKLENEIYSLMRGKIDGQLYQPILGHLYSVKESECYHVPFWKKSVIPLRVQLWSEKSTNLINADWQNRRNSLCNLTENRLALCRTNLTVLPMPVKTMRIVAKQMETVFYTNPIDFAYKKSKPEIVTFTSLIPLDANCSVMVAPFAKSSFVKFLTLEVELDQYALPATTSKKQEEIRLTNVLLHRHSVIKVNLNMTNFRHVREDFVRKWAVEITTALEGASKWINPENMQIIWTSVNEFLCPVKIAFDDLKKEVKVRDWDSLVFPSLEGIFWVNKTSNQFCTIPTIDAPTKEKRTTTRQNYNNHYNQNSETTVVSQEENLISYLTFVVDRRMEQNSTKLSIPLTLLDTK